MKRSLINFRQLKAAALGAAAGLSLLIASSADAATFKNSKLQSSQFYPRAGRSYDSAGTREKAVTYTERISRGSGKYTSSVVARGSSLGHNTGRTNGSQAVTYPERIGSYSGKFRGSVVVDYSGSGSQLANQR